MADPITFAQRFQAARSVSTSLQELAKGAPISAELAGRIDSAHGQLEMIRLASAGSASFSGASAGQLEADLSRLVAGMGRTIEDLSTALDGKGYGVRLARLEALNQSAAGLTRLVHGGAEGLTAAGMKGVFGRLPLDVDAPIDVDVPNTGPYSDAALEQAKPYILAMGAICLRGADVETEIEFYDMVMSALDQLAEDTVLAQLRGFDLEDPTQAQEWADSVVVAQAESLFGMTNALSDAGFEPTHIREILEEGIERGGVLFLIGIGALPALAQAMVREGADRAEVVAMVESVGVAAARRVEADRGELAEFISDHGESGDHDFPNLVGNIELERVTRYRVFFEEATLAWNFLARNGIEGEERYTLVVQIVVRKTQNVIPLGETIERLEQAWAAAGWTQPQLTLTLQELPPQDFFLQDRADRVESLVAHRDQWQQETGLSHEELFDLWLRIMRLGNEISDTDLAFGHLLRRRDLLFNQYETLVTRLEARGIQYDSNETYAQHLFDEAGTLQQELDDEIAANPPEFLFKGSDN